MLSIISLVLASVGFSLGGMLLLIQIGMPLNRHLLLMAAISVAYGTLNVWLASYALGLG